MYGYRLSSFTSVRDGRGSRFDSSLRLSESSRGENAVEKSWNRDHNPQGNRAARRPRLLVTAALVSLLFAGVGVTVAAPAANAAIVGSCSYTSSQPTLRRGSSGVAVQQLQCELNHSLYYTTVDEDGQFGPLTEDAVRTFQICAHITVDGVAGPETWSYLNFWVGSPDWLYC